MFFFDYKLKSINFKFVKGSFIGKDVRMKQMQAPIDLTLRILTANQGPVATNVLALLRPSVTTDVIGWVQMGPLDLSKENNNFNAMNV